MDERKSNIDHQNIFERNINHRDDPTRLPVKSQEGDRSNEENTLSRNEKEVYVTKLIRDKRHKHSKHHRSCRKHKKHRSRCRKRSKHHSRRGGHHSRRGGHHSQPAIHNNNNHNSGKNNQTHSDNSKHDHDDASDDASDDETDPDHSNHDRGMNWRNQEETIDEWSIRRRKEHRKTSELSGIKINQQPKV